MPQYIRENGQMVPAIPAGTLAQPQPGFLTFQDMLNMFQQQGGGVTGVAPQPSTPIPMPDPMVGPAQYPRPANLQPGVGPLTDPSFDAVWGSLLGQEMRPAVTPPIPPVNPMAGPTQAAPPQQEGDIWSGIVSLFGKDGVINNAGAALNSAAGGAAQAIANQPMWSDFTVTPWNGFGMNKPAEGAAAAAGPKFTPGLPGSGGSGTSPGIASKIMGVENGTGNPAARNPASSAMGNGQFIKSTWLEFMHEFDPNTKKVPEEELLKLRADPTWSEKATSWYAGKAVDALDEINKPATDTNIYLHHFLGPGGMKALLNADPSAPVSSVLEKGQISANPTVLGGARTVQDVIDWASAKMGDYEGAPPPPMPMTPMPDFSGMEDWLNKAAPVPVNPQDLQNAQFANLLSGIGQGLNSAEVNMPGGGANIWTGLAAGIGGANANNQKLALDFQNQFQDQSQKYALGRAEVAGQQAQTKAEVDAANAQTQWKNQVSGQEYVQAKSDAQLAKEKLASTPKILDTNDKGIIVQTPDGGVQHISLESQWDQMASVSKAMGQDSATFRQMKYGTMAQTGSNILSFEAEIIKDLLSDGMGQAIWGDSFADAVAEAEKTLPAALTSKPELYQAELNKALAGLLLGTSQSAGNFDWVLGAAQMGHPGAMMLVQGGQLSGGL